MGPTFFLAVTVHTAEMARTDLGCFVHHPSVLTSMEKINADGEYTVEDRVRHLGILVRSFRSFLIIVKIIEVSELQTSLYIMKDNKISSLKLCI